jgi:BMFP domain-containing protein YqiC
MYPVIIRNSDQTITKNSFWDQFSHIPEALEYRLPTFDRSLDAYFDQNFAAIIKEWELVTENDLHHLESRLARVSDEISGLFTRKMSLESRTKELDDLITSLERSL